MSSAHLHCIPSVSLLFFRFCDKCIGITHHVLFHYLEFEFLYRSVFIGSRKDHVQYVCTWSGWQYLLQLSSHFSQRIANMAKSRYKGTVYSLSHGGHKCKMKEFFHIITVKHAHFPCQKVVKMRLGQFFSFLQLDAPRSFVLEYVCNR